MKDLANKTFGRLTVVKRSERKMKDTVLWVCQCECGNKKEIASKNLLSGVTSSCGCLAKESAKKLMKDVLVKRENYSEEERKEWIEKSVTTKKETLYNEGAYLPHLTRIRGKNNKSGIKGVFWDKSRGKWRAEIALRGKNKYLGRFDTLEEAENARKKAEEEYFKPLLEPSDREKE